MTERAPSLELAEVTRRFAESERLLGETREHLSSILKNEARSQMLADSLTESARAVTEFSSRAETILGEAQSAVREARVVLEAGGDVISGNALAAINERVTSVHEQVLQLAVTQSNLVGVVSTHAEASQMAEKSTRGELHTLVEQVGDLRERIVQSRTTFLVAATVLVVAQAATLIVIALK